MDKQTNEVLLILQEECAEVIQAVSKIFRFGFIATHPDTPSKTNTDHLEEEIGDLLAMIDILQTKGIISENMLIQYKQRKFAKLKEWSTLDL